jgi:hypothetical protein
VESELEDVKVNKANLSPPQRLWKYLTGPWFTATESFLSLPSFRVPVSIAVFFAALAWFQIWITRNLELDLSADLSTSLGYFKVPLAILAALIPVLGLLNANHKSEQSKAAIELSRSQNNFANYYKHLEEFCKYCESVEQRHASWEVRIEARRLHAVMFTGARGGNFEISRTWLNPLVSTLKEVNDSLNRFGEEKLNGEADTSEPSNATKMFTIRYMKFVKITKPTLDPIDDIFDVDVNLSIPISAFQRTRYRYVYSANIVIKEICDFAPSCDELMAFDELTWGYPGALSKLLVIN